MLLTITTTHRPARDLGYLLHKHPDRLHTETLWFGAAHVFYPEADDSRCTAALLLEIDPLALTGRHPAGEHVPLQPYVNDRPYAASSLLSVAMARVLGSAMGGRSRERPELAAAPLPLEAHLPVLPCHDGGEAWLRQLFEPLGYRVEAEALPLDPAFPEWGAGEHFNVRLARTCRLSELLGHLYVLVPVLDMDKHYWVGDDEVDKLLRRAGDWLADHPRREEIARRYLKGQRSLTRQVLARLRDDQGEADADPGRRAGREGAWEEGLGLHAQRLRAVVEALRASGARRVLDLGCGEGRLIQELLREEQFTEIVGADVSPTALAAAGRRLDPASEPLRPHASVRLLQSSVLYRDSRLTGYDAAALVEVVEHIEPARLGGFEAAVFACARPTTVVLTTPNREYNPLFSGLAPGAPRHPDHRFEWTRAEFQAWAQRVARTHDYAVSVYGVGPEDPERGAPTQMGVFRR